MIFKTEKAAFLRINSDGQPLFCQVSIEAFVIMHAPGTKYTGAENNNHNNYNNYPFPASKNAPVAITHHKSPHIGLLVYPMR
jgi:hypothetical protein